MPALVTAWSSTTRTRTGRLGRSTSSGASDGERDPRADPGAPSRCRLELERAAQQPGPLGHPAQPEAVPLAVSLDLGPIEAGAVVLHEQRDARRREYTSPTRTDAARAWRIALVSASWAIRNSVWATSGGGHRAAGRHEAGVDHARAVRPRELELERLFERAAFQR